MARSVSLMCLLLAFALALPAHAQQLPSDLSLRIAEADVTDFPQVDLIVTVRDANGVPVPGLDARAFEINEDRVPEARPIASVEPLINPDLPVSLMLVIDISGSMADQPLADAQAAARTLIEQLGEEDEVGFIAFAGAVDLDSIAPQREHLPTTDRVTVLNLVDLMEADGGTPLYDALYKGVLWAQEASLGHRAVILLTDGVDEDPGSIVASDETPIQEATRANVPVFTIGLGSEIESGYLERVARTTGGTYQETPDSDELTALFLNVLERLKQQYVITYESALPGDGELHRAQVDVAVGDRQTSDEFEIGPLLLLAEPTSIPPTAVPTSGPPSATSTPASTGGREQAPAGRALLPIVAATGGLGALVAIALPVVFVVRRRKDAQQEYCLSCGRELDPGKSCPYCGPDAGRFKKPEGTT